MYQRINRFSSCFFFSSFSLIVTYYPRLVNGYNWYEGRVEVWDGSRWERLCNVNFYEYEASTVCKQLGFPGYEDINNADLYYPIENAPASDVSFNCGPDDYALSSCSISGITVGRYCGSVSVRCTVRRKLYSYSLHVFTQYSTKC